MISTPEARFDNAPTSAVPAVLIFDHRLLLEALQDQRGLLPGVRIVGRALDITNGLELVSRTAPKLLLVDGPNFQAGFREFSEEIPFRLGQIRLAILADGFSDTQFDLALSVGARGLFSQMDSLTDIGAGLQAVAAGEIRVSPRFHGFLTADPRGGNYKVHRRHRLKHFSDRQLEVLMQLAEGRRVKDIAEQMQLSEKAIESHKYRLMNRLGIHDRVELCRWAIREGLISA